MTSDAYGRHVVDDTSDQDDVVEFDAGHDQTQTATGWRTRSLRRSAGLGLGYLVVSYVVLYPILSTPMYADDFVNPFAQAADGGPTVVDGVSFAWTGVTEGASFRVLGAMFGSFVNWLLLWLSATFDIGISTLYSGLKFALIIACASSIAWFWSELSRLVGRRIEWFGALVYVSVTMFTTLQIHAAWSNDPVGNYPLVGFGGTGLGFVFLGFTIRFVRLNTAAAAAVATLAALVSVSYYEINVGAVMGASAILALAVVRSLKRSDHARTAVLGSAAILFTPALFLLAGRQVTGDQAATYGGTTIRIGGSALRAFGLGGAGTIPGAAWRLSVDSLGGVLDMVPFAIGVAVLLTWIAAIHRQAALSANASIPSVSDRALATAAACGLGIYWLVAILLQAITVKVQDETLELGYVYSSYSFGAAIIALLLAIAARATMHDRRLRTALPVLAACAVAFVLVQQTINWRLAEQLNSAVTPSRQLLDAFDDSATPPERCQALLNWSVGGWPDYYEVGMIDGLDVMYRYYFGEPFCEAFVRPP